ncbi:nucleotidyltransferase family protein [Psychrosphaera sp. B3R10]|uniref:nucleotidyltransferase family protein n=1 Tax=unclassified Psychrosphaera TaxID=2641570 RepID=UPI001C08551D|nr:MULTISPECIES: nucleotidyltransferase family protein [unclassified Psychrosphaera]MBU2883939.1 nucleotidyltransferase family protein [Psychrosphaera sp. I2R16]MBU2990134.1 nucleotidyltransferase family protein [Psychrosphaera sp. B3R10]
MTKPFNLNPAILLLAAGQSRRFNGVKQLSLVATSNGKTPLLQAKINTLVQLNLPLFAAIRDDIKLANFTPIKLNGSPKLTWITPQNSRLGMGHTIADSVDILLKQLPNCSHIVITLCDQVALDTAAYQSLVRLSAQQPEKIICCETQDGLSVPAVFPKAWFSQLKQLTGDKGAKHILNNAGDQRQTILLNQAIIDIDTKQELEDWNKAQTNQFTKECNALTGEKAC